MRYQEVLIILLIVLLLFGAPKLPQLARSLGQSLRILKDETKTQNGEDTPAGDPEKPTASSSDEPRDTQK